jgi:hypothetical protein
MENGSRQGAVFNHRSLGKGEEGEEKGVRIVALMPLRSHASGIIIAQRATTTKAKTRKAEDEEETRGQIFAQKGNKDEPTRHVVPLA